jgi:hypothetical protein
MLNLFLVKENRNSTRKKVLTMNHKDAQIVEEQESSRECRETTTSLSVIDGKIARRVCTLLL